MSGDKPEIITLAETFTKPDVMNRLIFLMMTTWGERDPHSSVSQHPASYVATFADMARAIVADGVVAAEPEWEYEVTYSSTSTTTIDGHRLRRSSGMLPSLAAATEWMKFTLNPIAHRRTKAIPAGEWERLPTQQEGPDDV